MKIAESTKQRWTYWTFVGCFWLAWFGLLVAPATRWHRELAEHGLSSTWQGHIANILAGWLFLAGLVIGYFAIERLNKWRKAYEELSGGRDLWMN